MQIYEDSKHLAKIVSIFKPYSNEKKVHPYTGTEALYRPYSLKGSRGIALLFLNHGTRRW